MNVYMYVPLPSFICQSVAIYLPPKQTPCPVVCLGGKLNTSLIYTFGDNMSMDLCSEVPYMSNLWCLTQSGCICVELCATRLGYDQANMPCSYNFYSKLTLKSANHSFCCPEMFFHSQFFTAIFQKPCKIEASYLDEVCRGDPIVIY